MKMLLLLMVLAPQVSSAKTMVASWYAHGKVTANGEKFNPDGISAAHKTLPFGTKLLLQYGRKKLWVSINDRGPFIRGRELDLSRGSARALGLESVGRIKLVKLIKPAYTAPH